MKSIVRNLIRGLANLWVWIPVIWKDRDYDHYYMEKILHHKLKMMYEFFNSDQSYTNWETPETAKALKALRICVTILDRRLNDFYLLELTPHDGDYSLEEANRIYSVEQRDERVLGALLGKYISWWWD